MKFTELKDNIAAGAAKVYLFEGEDAYFRKRAEEMVKEAFLTLPELNFSSFEGESLRGAAIGGLVSAVRNYPFMAERRIVRVTDFHPTESEFENYLKPLFEDFPDTAILMIVNRESKRGADLKRKKCVTYVDCGKADAETVARWIYITLKRAQISCSAATCASIADYCLADMSRVSVEVRKLIDYKGSGVLTQEEADDLVYKDADYRIYEMTGAIARGDHGTYILVSSDLKSKGSDEISILNGLFSHFRNLLSASSSPLSDAAYARENGMKEYAVKMNRRQAAAVGEKNLAAWTGMLYDALSDIKSGAMTPASALQICENSIFFGRK